MSEELLFKSGIELKKLIKNKEISPVELTKLSLERIEETEPKVNAFFSIMYKCFTTALILLLHL